MPIFIGSPGDDIFTGGLENDTATGNGGNDQLSGNGGNDDLSGDAGADTLDGGDGDDTLYGGQRSPLFNQPFGGTPHVPPVLDTGTEVDTLRGGAGNDMIFAGYGDNVDGGANDSRTDRLYLSLLGAPTGVTADFRQVSVVIGGGTITGIENIMWLQGSNFDDDINLETIGGNPWGAHSAVYGMAGNDRLIAGSYTSLLFGGDGNDIVDGRLSSYLERVEGGTGDDTLYTSASGAPAYGGDGNDTIYSHSATFGGAGNDLIVLQNISNISIRGYAYGEEGNDEIRATAQFGSLIVGGSGADLLLGNAGNDVLFSADRIAGTSNPADDMGLERDLIWGGDGNDTIAAGYGDGVNGSNGTDTLRLSFGGATSGVTFDTAPLVAGQAFTLGGGTIQNIETLVSLRGSDFADRLTLATQPTLLTVDAGDGDDVVSWGMSSVSVNGGDGDDRFINGAAGDILDGGAGFDTIDYRNATSGVTLSLAAAGQTASGPGGDQLKNIENIDGSPHGDTLYGNSDSNVLRGMMGNDALTGFSGNDVLDGGPGNDTTDGGFGHDYHYVDSALDSVIERAGEGSDRVFASVSYSLAPLAEVEMLTTTDSAGTAAIDLTGSDTANFIYANAGSNTLSGRDGSDFLVGLAGNDFLDGGVGKDITDGGPGDDYHYVDNALDSVIERAGEGSDRVFASVSYSLAALAYVEMLTTTDSAGTAAIDLTGSDTANFIYGNAGSNTLSGRDGSDFLVGLAGNDVLDGGVGKDKLNGGDGADDFRFTADYGAGNFDTVMDFATGTDRLVLENEVFAGLSPGALDPSSFRAGSTAGDADDRVLYDQATGALYFDPDGTGPAAAIQFAYLQPGAPLAASDIFII